MATVSAAGTGSALAAAPAPGARASPVMHTRLELYGSPDAVQPSNLYEAQRRIGRPEGEG